MRISTRTKNKKIHDIYDYFLYIYICEHTTTYENRLQVIFTIQSYFLYYRRILLLLLLSLSDSIPLDSLVLTTRIRSRQTSREIFIRVRRT